MRDELRVLVLRGPMLLNRGDQTVESPVMQAQSLLDRVRDYARKGGGDGCQDADEALGGAWRRDNLI